MSEDKKTKKEIPEEKSKSKHGMSKETLEKLLETKIHKEKLPPKEEFESRISEEEIAFLNKKEKTPTDSERINPNQQVRILERDLSNEPNPNKEENSGNSKNGEYLSKNTQQSDGEKKYQSYESNITPKTFRKEEEISKGWSKQFQTEKREFKEIHSEMGRQKNDRQYETYFTPKNLSDEELKEKQIGRTLPEFEFQEKKMHYYKD